MSQVYEIEIKSLLGSKEKADALREKILNHNSGFKLVSRNKQLNHYFNLKNANKFQRSLTPHVERDKKALFEKILDEGKDFSVRTRDTDGKVLLVIKASIGDDTSANGVSRMEFESEMKMILDELDKFLLLAGLEYQAKWSREREEYKSPSFNICLDRNAGYGYIAEFEKILADPKDADQAKLEIFDLMKEMGVEELPQDRLERMFAHYNGHWSEYYGTERVFNIE